MFLSTLHDKNSFGLNFFHDTTAVCASIEADLRNLPDFSGRDIIAYNAGSSIILDGTVTSDLDYNRALNVATDLAGEDRVICRITVATGFLRY